MGTTGSILIIALVVILAGFAINVADTTLKWGLLPWHTVTAQVDSANQIITKTYDADNALYNYEWFKQQKADIDATVNKIQITKDQIDQFKIDNGNMSTWDTTTKQTYQQMQTVYRGQQSYYEDQVAVYNARSLMANRNIFINGLPAKVDKILWT